MPSVGGDTGRDAAGHVDGGVGVDEQPVGVWVKSVWPGSGAGDEPHALEHLRVGDRLVDEARAGDVLCVVRRTCVLPVVPSVCWPSPSTLSSNTVTGLLSLSSVPCTCWPLAPSSSSRSRSAFVGEAALTVPVATAGASEKEIADERGTGV